MSERVKCKMCGMERHIHDTLEGYCLLCASEKLKDIDKKEGEPKVTFVTNEV